MSHLYQEQGAGKKMIPAQHMTQNNVIQPTRKELTQTPSKERAENESDFKEQSKNEGNVFT